jgi:hypothetical protein
MCCPESTQATCRAWPTSSPAPATGTSVFWLADRYNTRDVLTLDHRHFGVIRPLAGGRFRLLPTLRRR